MAAKVYTILAKGVTVVGANTMAFVRSGTTATLKVVRCSLSQGDKTAASEQQAYALYTQVTTFPTLVSATPFQMGGVNDAVSTIIGGTAGAAGTCGINASAEGAGAKTFGPSGGFNNLNGWEWVSTPKEEIILPAGSASGFGIFLVTVPTTKTLWYAYINYEEL
jgi:hypothetical protein